MLISRVLLISEHSLIVSGLRWILQGVEGIEQIDQAVTESQAIEVIKNREPNLAIIDTNSTRLDTLGLSERLRKMATSLRTILLLEPAENFEFRQYLKTPADAYVSRDLDHTELITALASIDKEGSYVSPLLSKAMLTAYQAQENVDNDLLNKLTPRQLEVLRLVAEGLGTKEIAKRLKVGARTVETHRHRIMARLEIHDVVNLVHFALRNGLIRRHP